MRNRTKRKNLVALVPYDRLKCVAQQSTGQTQPWQLSHNGCFGPKYGMPYSVYINPWFFYSEQKYKQKQKICKNTIHTNACENEIHSDSVSKVWFHSKRAPITYTCSRPRRVLQRSTDCCSMCRDHSCECAILHITKYCNNSNSIWWIYRTNWMKNKQTNRLFTTYYYDYSSIKNIAFEKKKPTKTKYTFILTTEKNQLVLIRLESNKSERENKLRCRQTEGGTYAAFKIPMIKLYELLVFIVHLWMCFFIPNFCFSFANCVCCFNALSIRHANIISYDENTWLVDPKAVESQINSLSVRHR